MYPPFTQPVRLYEDHVTYNETSGSWEIDSHNLAGPSPASSSTVFCRKEYFSSVTPTNFAGKNWRQRIKRLYKVFTAFDNKIASVIDSAEFYALSINMNRIHVVLGWSSGSVV